MTKIDMRYFYMPPLRKRKLSPSWSGFLLLLNLNADFVRGLADLTKIEKMKELF